MNVEALNLLEAAKNNNTEALIALFDRFAPMVYKYALGLSGDPMAADNVVGDVFAKLIEQLYAGKGPKTNLRSYLYETAYHLVVDESREQKHQISLEVVDYRVRSEFHGSLVVEVESRVLTQGVLGALQELSDKQRNVIVLRFIEGLSIKETAEIMHETEHNIKVLQFRGTAILRKALGVNEEEVFV